MKKNLKATLDIIKNKFKDRSFTVQQLQAALDKAGPELLRTTLRWRLSALKATGKIEPLARGRYVRTRHRPFELKLDPDLNKISKKIRKQFPYTSSCVWPSSFLNQFTIHQPSILFCLIEIEKEAMESVFSFLQEHHKNVFLNPTKKEIDLYLLNRPKSIIVKTFIQRAPVFTDPLQGNQIPKLEKILVDLLADPDIFFIYQGSELENIWRECFRKYAVNRSTLYNYAKRRLVLEKVHKLVRKLELQTNKERQQ
jgi:hypothetical protein